MPRSRGGASRPSAPSRASAPVRPTAPAQSHAPQQQRPMSTTAKQAPAQASQGSGLFGQMASTAAGVAVGSSIGHAVGGWFGGGSSAHTEQAPAEYAQDNYAQPGQQMDQGLYGSQYNSQAAGNSSGAQAQGPCAGDIKQFTTCMEQNRGDMNVCGWYLEQLKACQQAAGRY